MAGWIEKIAKTLRLVKPAGIRDPQGGKGANERPKSKRLRKLVADRPVHLPQDYQLSTDEQLADEVFIKLKEGIFRALDQQGAPSPSAQPAIFREHGMTAGNTPYFYLKPVNEKGWLFERSGAGWVVTRAQKIVGEDLFLRGVSAWDVANIYALDDLETDAGTKTGGTAGISMPRVMSRALGRELLSIPVYQHKVLRELDLISPPVKAKPPRMSLG